VPAAADARVAAWLRFGNPPINAASARITPPLIADARNLIYSAIRASPLRVA
jgi:hypothetical protein